MGSAPEIRFSLRFCKFCANPIDLKLDCIFGKPMKRRFQRYLVHTEITSTFTYESNTFLCEKSSFCLFKPMGRKCRKIPKQPLSLRHVNPHLINECLGDPTHHAKRQLNRFTHFCTTTQQSPHWLQWDALNSSQNCSFPFNDHHPI